MNHGHSLGGPGERHVQSPYALGLLPQDAGRFDHDRPIHLQALDQPDGHHGHPGVEAPTGRTTEGHASPLEGLLDVTGLGISSDHGEVAGTHRLQLGTHHFGQAIEFLGVLAGQPDEAGCLAVTAHRSGRSEVRCGHGQHPGRHIHDWPRDPVAHSELVADCRLPIRQVGEDPLPVTVGPRTRGLGDVTHHGHGPVQRPSVQHPQVHRREVLNLVDHDVPVGADRIMGLGTRSGPQHSAGLVQQRRIRRRPVHVVSHLLPGPKKCVDLIGGEAPVGSPDQRP